jgi:hypothetical protein
MCQEIGKMLGAMIGQPQSFLIGGARSKNDKSETVNL